MFYQGKVPIIQTKVILHAITQKSRNREKI